MSLVNMKEMLSAARKSKKAVGAFNVTNYETAAAVLGYNPYAASVFGNVIICGRDKSGSPVGLSDAQELSLWRRLDRVLRGAARAR